MSDAEEYDFDEEPVSRVRKPPFFARAWVRRTILCLSIVTTGGVGISLISIGLKELPSVTTGISIAFLTGSLIVFYCIISIFDPSVPLGWFFKIISEVESLAGTFLGILLKIMAIGHALSAMSAMVLITLCDLPPVPLVLLYLLTGWLWLMFALAYLGGDAYWTVLPQPKAAAGKR